MIIALLLFGTLVFAGVFLVVQLLMRTVFGTSRSAKCWTFGLDGGGNIVRVKLWTLSASAGEKNRVIMQRKDRNAVSVETMCQHPNARETCASSMPFVEVGDRIATCPCRCHNSDDSEAEITLPSTSITL